jgi:hypothetical protein
MRGWASGNSVREVMVVAPLRYQCAGLIRVRRN